MLYRIIQLIIDVAGGLLVGACLLRLWMQRLRLNAKNPIGHFVMALTDWIVRPLRRLLPAYGNVDWASLVAAYALSVVAVLIVWAALGLSAGLAGPPDILQTLWVALLWMIKWMLYMLQLIVVIAAVLSWVNPFSPFLPIFDALTVPLLRPLRRVLPPIGRVDLSLLVLFVLIQIALLVLGSIGPI